MKDAGRYILDVGGGQYIVLPAKIVALINPQLSAWRKKVRNRHAELDAALLDFARVAMTVTVPARTTISVAFASPDTRLDEWVTTKVAAGLIGVSESAVRKAISDKRLEASKLNGGWCIPRQAVEQYRANRHAA